MRSKPLANDLTWSVSRNRLFRACPRAYYYQYYGAWGGWASDVPGQARLLYTLKQMTSFPLWGGSVVHQVIQEALRQMRESRLPPTLDQLQKRARALLNAGWKQSRDKLWKQDPKRNVNLFEHYYAREGGEITREEIDALKEKVFNALEGFLSSGVPQEVLPLDATRWGQIDMLNSFVAGELPATENAPALPLKVWCALDFSYVDPEGVLHILDWKTGTEHREELRLQLACYALYAMDALRFPLEKLRLNGVFLNDSGRISTYEISSESLVNAKSQILNSAQAMRNCLRDPVANLAEEETFPCAANPQCCTRCPFLQVCPAAQENNLLAP